MAIDQFPLRAYCFEKSWIYGVAMMALDFLGLSNFFGANPMNGTWWYMSAAVVFIVCTPFLCFLIQREGSVFTLGLLLILPRINGGYPGGTHFLSFLPAFCIGMILAREEFFEKWEMYWRDKQKTAWIATLKFIVMTLTIVWIYKLYYYLPTDKFWDVKWGIIPAFVIVFLNDYVVNIPIVKNILLFCGKHSMNVLLLHTFIRYYYFEEFIYSQKHVALVLMVLYSVSVVFSICIEMIKARIQFDKQIDRLIGWIKRVSVNRIV